MTGEEKLTTMRTMLGSVEENDDTLNTYLNFAKRKLLNHIYPFENQTELDARYELDQIELAIYYFNQQGGEGESEHIENGVHRKWRSESEILASIPRRVGVPQ